MADIAPPKHAPGGGKRPGMKVPKVKLTKEQLRYVHDLTKLENRIAICREFIALWANFFRFFAADLSEREITAEEEKGFFQVSTQLARKHFLFVEMMADSFERGNDIINVVCMAVSLSNIQGMQENTRAKLELDWHSLYLDMNKALGRLVRRLPGNLPLSEALASVDKANVASLGATSKRAAGGGGHNKFLAAILAFPPMGMLGLDCFYLGLPKRGVLRLVTAGGLVLWSLIDFFRILMGKMEDGDGQLVD